MGASVLRVRAGEFSPDPATPDLTIQLCVAGEPRPVRFDLGVGLRSGRIGPGCFGITRPHHNLDFRGDGEPLEFLILRVPWRQVLTLLAAHADTNRLDFDPWYARVHQDAQIERWCQGIWTCAGEQSLGSAVQTDGLVTAVVGRLLTWIDGGFRSPASTQSPAKLSPAAWRRVRDRMHADMTGPLSLRELADAAGLSPFYFARLFKETTGVSPHAYLIRLRVERAKTLMRDHPEWTIAAVAAACGFADQAHLTRHFKRLLGVTPGRWQRE